MKSLRVRLSLAFVLVAWLPMAVVGLLAQRGIEARTREAYARQLDTRTEAGRRLLARHAADMSATNRLTQWNDSLHHGTWGGLPTQLMWVFCGLMATALSFAGAMVYASRVAQPDDRRRAIRRIWSGTVLVKFGYPLFVMALVAIGIMRFA